MRESKQPAQHQAITFRRKRSKSRSQNDLSAYAWLSERYNCPTGAGGINDNNLIVGADNPSGKTTPEAFQGTEWKAYVLKPGASAGAWHNGKTFRTFGERPRIERRNLCFAPALYM